MKKLKRELVISKKEAREINRLLHTEPKSRKECFGQNETKSYTISFGDHVEMDIKICGVTYEEGESNLPWTEAVLFKYGHELCCSGPKEKFFGKWKLEYAGTEYKVIVKELNITEQEFKILLDSLWCCFTFAAKNADLIAEMRRNGLPVEQIASDIPIDDSIILRQLYTVMKLIGADSNIAGTDRTRNLSLGEEVIEFMYDVHAIHPDCSDEFPKESYPCLLKLFTNAGVVLPWNK